MMTELNIKWPYKGLNFKKNMLVLMTLSQPGSDDFLMSHGACLGLGVTSPER
jgi:hypothetical protein